MRFPATLTRLSELVTGGSRLLLCVVPLVLVCLEREQRGGGNLQGVFRKPASQVYTLRINYWGDDDEH